MFPVLLDDQSLFTEFETFIEAIDNKHELALDGQQQFPVFSGLCVCIFHQMAFTYLLNFIFPYWVNLFPFRVFMHYFFSREECALLVIVLLDLWENWGTVFLFQNLDLEVLLPFSCHPFYFYLLLLFYFIILLIKFAIVFCLALAPMGLGVGLGGILALQVLMVYVLFLVS